VDIRILGTLEVFDGDRAIALSGANLRALLALLVRLGLVSGSRT
jgi:hypothetical protein